MEHRERERDGLTPQNIRLLDALRDLRRARGGANVHEGLTLDRNKDGQLIVYNMPLLFKLMQTMPEAREVMSALIARNMVR